MSILLKLFQKTEQEETLPNAFNEASFTLIPKPNKDTIIEGITSQISDEHRCIFNKILANQIKKYIEKIMYHNQMGFIPDMQG